MILHAVANNSPKVLKYLIEIKNYNVDIQSKNSETALMRAVVENNVEIIKMLLSYKPNLELVNQVKSEFTLDEFECSRISCLQEKAQHCEIDPRKWREI